MHYQQLMPANHKVSVAWQIFFTFIPIVNFWAFYRIRKLTKFLLYVIIPAIAASIAIASLFIYLTLEPIFDRSINATAIKSANASSNGFANGYVVLPQINVETVQPEPWPGMVRMSTLAGQIIGVGLQIWSIYLIIIWSRQHNRQFDQPTTQTEQQ